MGDLCPGVGGDGLDIAAKARRAFGEIGPKNPLAKLSKRDKESLWSLLSLYEKISVLAGMNVPSGHCDRGMASNPG